MTHLTIPLTDRLREALESVARYESMRFKADQTAWEAADTLMEREVSALARVAYREAKALSAAGIPDMTDREREQANADFYSAFPKLLHMDPPYPRETRSHAGVQTLCTFAREFALPSRGGQTAQAHRRSRHCPCPGGCG